MLTSRDRLLSTSSDGDTTTEDESDPGPFLGTHNSGSSSLAESNSSGFEIVRVRSFVSTKGGAYENRGDSVCVRKKPKPRVLIKRQSELHIRHQWIQEEEAFETDPGHCSSADSFDEMYSRRDTVIERPRPSSTSQVPSPGAVDSSAGLCAAVEKLSRPPSMRLSDVGPPTGDRLSPSFLFPAIANALSSAALDSTQERENSINNGSLNVGEKEEIENEKGDETYSVLVLGSAGVGKTSLCHQMLTSEHLVNSDAAAAQGWRTVILYKKVVIYK